jgi:hypothetical protein
MAAATTTPVYNMVPIGEQTTDTTVSSATSFTAPERANAALMSAITQSCNFTIDGTTPTATVGLTLKAGDSAIMIPVIPGQVIKVIEQTATANFNIQWVRFGG